MNKAYLEITLAIEEQKRGAAAAVYNKYRAPFLADIAGAKSKELLVRAEDVVVLHGFDSARSAENYLTSQLFTQDVVGGLAPLLSSNPTVRIYTVV